MREQVGSWMPSGIYSSACKTLDPVLAIFRGRPSKRALIVSQHNVVKSAWTAFADLSFTVITGHRYHLGGFIGDQDAFGTWINEKTLHWTEAVTDLASIAKNNFP
jgi:hypothetical protein